MQFVMNIFTQEAIYLCFMPYLDIFIVMYDIRLFVILQLRLLFVYMEIQLHKSEPQTAESNNKSLIKIHVFYS